MSKKREAVILGRLLQKIAPKIGAKVILEPEWEMAGRIEFKSGKKSYFRYNTVDLNPIGSSDIAKDKDYANFFIHTLGYPIIPGSKTFFSDAWADAIRAKKRKTDDAYAYAAKLGFPVVVKPNSGSRGTGVAFVKTKAEFYKAMRFIFSRDRVGLIQKPVIGKDYRIVVLDNEIISAYERVPLSVIGDGRTTVLGLLKRKQRQFENEHRDTQIKFDDPRIQIKLSRQALTLDSVLKKSQHIFVLDNANLSTGGDSVDVTEFVHASFKRIAVALTKDMGLRFCGVDLIIDGDISEAAETYWVLEINAAPGLDHYAKSGKKQEAIVEALYLKVLQSLDT